MSYNLESESYIRDKVKVISNYTTKNELDHATGVDTSDLAAKKDFIALKTEVNKLDIINLLMNNLKTKVDDLDFGKLKIVLVAFKKLSDGVNNEVVKNTKSITLKTKVNNFEKKIPDATTLIHIKNSINSTQHR